jgi:hypothetical protein
MSVTHQHGVSKLNMVSLFKYVKLRRHTSNILRDSFWGWTPNPTVTMRSLIVRWYCIMAKVFVKLKFSVVLADGSAVGKPSISSISINGLTPRLSMASVTCSCTKQIRSSGLNASATHHHEVSEGFPQFKRANSSDGPWIICLPMLHKLEINDRGNPLRWPRNTLYPQKLALLRQQSAVARSV